MFEKFTNLIANRSNPRKANTKLLAPKLREVVHKQSAVLSSRRSFAAEMSLYGSHGERKYLNESERLRFSKALDRAATETRLFCFMLAITGARISELLAITPASIDIVGCTVLLLTLKRRRRGIVRELPLPAWLVAELNRQFDLAERQRDELLRDERLWAWSRTSGWRRVKAVMKDAGIHGAAAMPKGLRHTFGVVSCLVKVPLPKLQGWFGHASIETTSIYTQIAGEDEKVLASWVWDAWRARG
ncbi:MAG TPA: site-specific integrase [Pseudolabrys sp.]|nr:site-specific integrase [Pseudolabrys sp.]